MGARWREARVCGVAGGAATAGYALAAALHGAWPPGAAEVAVPFHAQLWDLAHGRAPGDLLFTWNSGYGAPFLADFFANLMNPFSWPAVLLPRGQGQLAVFLTALLSIGLGTALMAHVLGRLHAGPHWLRAVAALGYGLCAWVPTVGGAAPMWLWGLVSLPLLVLAGDWCLHERRWVAGSLCVALAWAGNLYTAAMATLTAGLVLAVRLLAVRRPFKAAVRTTGRAVTMAAAGIALAAPVLFTAVRAAQEAQPESPVQPLGPSGLGGHLAQLLPGTGGGPPVPDVSVGLLGLLLVAGLPFNRRVRPRERAVWCGLLALVVLSFVWTPTVLVWHGLAIPAGGPYRVAFVLSGLLVLAGWVSLAHRPDRWTLLGGAAVVLLVAAIAAARHTVPVSTWLLLAVGGAVLLGALGTLELRHTDRRAGATATAVLGCAVLGGLVWSAYAALGGPAGATATGASVRAAYAAVRQSADWPRARTDPGPHSFTPNDPLLLDGQGGGYASGYLPTVTALLLHDLGAGWAAGGRQTASVTDPVGRALFAVRTQLADGPTPAGFTVVRAAAAPPLVTVVPPGRAPDTSSVWSRQESLLGSPVYDVPEPVPDGGPAPTAHGTSGWSVPATPAGADGTAFAAVCTPGGTAYFHGVWFAGTVSALGTAYRSDGEQPTTAVPIHELGPVPADGRVRVVLHADAVTQVPARPIGCLRPGALEAAVARLTRTGATRVAAGGHTVTAALPPGSTGTALLSVPAATGWTCAADGGTSRAPVAVLGMVGVPLGAGADRIGCSFRPPGLDEGLTVALAAAAVTALAGVLGRLRHRPTRPPRRVRRRPAERSRHEGVSGPRSG
ncbi:YfhO family protein [Kitasatospora sp. CM 4170]|uniref:YfhO family protein n=1 Tax=Kitasatospora aburaviensis TaxID=67265 RepID=A0ABW1F1W3_9ACTN|nr:YfhO family protein [Kitasatospora sp. CM 4170]WNM47799.1 YfhO family protein [Kitasatospora sp. CM 4170]